jgi:DUF1680 family protein
VPFSSVRIRDDFWDRRLKINREISLPWQYKQCLENGRINAFRLQWKPGEGEAPHVFWDSDVAKWVEAASYSLATHPDPALEELLEKTVALMVSAQQPDGYLNTHFTVTEQDKRWTHLRDKHELYCAGHLMEAGVAHFQATGRRNLLDAVCRYADYIDSVFGPEPGKKRGYCGHEEIELALVRLYHATGVRRYLDLSRYFIDERGQSPLYFDVEAVARGETAGGDFYGEWGYKHYQAHQPVREQEVAVGHAVRAVYLYSGMADIARECGDPALLQAVRRLWDNVTKKKMYVTGAIGSARHNEGFSKAYDLPNETAYCETCAGIGLIFWAQRMLQLECDREYSDVIERSLYNGVLSGVSLEGTKFFYENPLASRGQHHRQPWFGCACCPSNLSRLMSSLGNHIYSEVEGGLAVHLYIGNEMRHELTGKVPVSVKMETHYPWKEKIRLEMKMEKAADFPLRLRIPAWCRKSRLLINGKEVPERMEKGYVVYRKLWETGDCIELLLEMKPEQVEANPLVLANQGKVALQRGPLVYCVEDADHSDQVKDLVFLRSVALQDRWDPELLGGVVVLEGGGLVREGAAWGEGLYRVSDTVIARRTGLKAIPYYAWDNRSPGAMKVWLPSEK